MHPATTIDKDDLLVVRRTSENLCDQSPTSHASIPVTKDAVHFLAFTPTSEATNACYIPVSESIDRRNYQGPVPIDVCHVQLTAFRDAVSERGPDPRDDLHVRSRSAAVQDKDSSMEKPVRQDDADSGRMTWLLGDDGLDSSVPSPEISTNISTSTCDSGLRAESGAAAHRGVDPPVQYDVESRMTPDDVSLVDLAVEELIGSTSPLANLPTETDVDVLIEMLRASPTSSRTISHASTISINDILDNDDLDLDLEPSLYGLTGGQFFDDLDVVASGRRTDKQTAGKSRAGVAKFRNTDRRRFGFVSDTLGSSRMGEDDAEKLTTSNGKTGMADDMDSDRKCVDEAAVKSELIAVKNVDELDRPSDSTHTSRPTVNEHPPEDRMTCRSERGPSEQDGTSSAVAILNVTQVDVSRQRAPGELKPQSDRVMEQSEHLEHSDTKTVLEAVHAVSSPEDEYSGFSSDTTCRFVERVERNVDDGQSVMKSTASALRSDPVNQESKKCGTASRESALKRLADVVQDRPNETSSSRTQPIVRRRSLDWKAAEEVPKSMVEVGKDKVTTLTAYFEEVHAERCPGCQVCLTGTVERPFVIRRRASLPAGAGTGLDSSDVFLTTGDQRSVDELPAEARPTSTLALDDSTSSDGQDKPIATSTPVSMSVSGLVQALTSLPASSVQTPSIELKQDHSCHSRPDSRACVTATEDGGSDIQKTMNDVSLLSSRRVVSLPDVYGESAVRSRDARTQKEFRFRVAKVRSHSLRSFNELTVSVVARRSTASRTVEPVTNQPSVRHSRSSAEPEQSSRNVEGMNTHPVVGKSTDSKSRVSGVDDQASTVSLAERLKSANTVGIADPVSLDNLLAELCIATDGKKERGSSLTPEAIRKYRIEPRKRGGGWPLCGPRPGDVGGQVSGLTHRASDDDEVMMRKHGALERRIDAMLFDADRQRSDNESPRHGRGRTRRNVPRTTTPLTTSAAHVNSSYATRPVSVTFDL